MTEIFLRVVPYLVLLSHVLIVLVFLFVIFRNTWGRGVVQFVGKNALLLGLVVSLGSVIGSLYYSEVVGFEACVLCWWQRVFLYPQAVIFAIALWKKDLGVFSYSLALTILAGVVALYQTYANFSGNSLLPCTAAEGACSKIYVMEFGYITIPVMSLTVVLYLLLLVWINKIYRNENSNA